MQDIFTECHTKLHARLPATPAQYICVTEYACHATSPVALTIVRSAEYSFEISFCLTL